MLRKLFCTVCTLLVLQRVQCAGPPKVTGSYIAWGEITQPIKDIKDAELQVAFEESYDANTENSAFVVWMAGKNVTFIQNFKTNQTFRYTEGKECAQTDETEWITSDYPPGLLTYEDDDGHIKFSLRQLFNIPEKYLQKDKSEVRTVYRGVPAFVWFYEIVGKDERGTRKKLNIRSYWSDGNWNTSSNEERAPLAFIVEKNGYYVNSTIESTVTSVFGFVTGTYDRKFFQPLQGIICANRSQTLKFPSVQNIKAIAIHSEMVLPDFQEIKYVDTYFDPGNQLIRIDVERIREEDPIAERKSKRYESEIAIGKMGVVFRQSVFKDAFTCEVIPFKDYLNDLQNFIDIKQNLTRWKMGKLFGLNDTNYVYTGKTMKRDIPCHVFQGIRKDWPEVSANVTSLWEWCFNVNMSKDNDIVMFLNDEMGLINAQVTILSSGDSQNYPPGFRMFHHFYEVTASEPDILDASRFDIARCFDESLRRSVQFYLELKVTDSNRHLAENLTSDISFLQKWKAVIYKSTDVPSYTLRITRLTATIDDKKMYIKFIILNDHPKLPIDVWTDQISAFDAERNLRKRVNDGSVSISHSVEKGQNPLIFTAANHSVSLQINPEFDHHSLPPPPEPSTTTARTNPPFTLRTEPEIGSKSSITDDKVTDSSTVSSSITNSDTTGSNSITNSGTTRTETDKPTTPFNKERIIKKSGHQPGTVATVSLAMILVGISIGSAGTFCKYYGLPSCTGR